MHTKIQYQEIQTSLESKLVLDYIVASSDWKKARNNGINGISFTSGRSGWSSNAYDAKCNKFDSTKLKNCSIFNIQVKHFIFKQRNLR